MYFLSQVKKTFVRKAQKHIPVSCDQVFISVWNYAEGFLGKNPPRKNITLKNVLRKRVTREKSPLSKS